MIPFKNPITGKTVMAQAEITRKDATNGENSINGSIVLSSDVIKNIGERWSFVFEGETYIVTYAKQIDNGISVELEFDAVHEFFDKMDKSVIKTETSGSHPFTWYLDRIFENSGYSYSLQTSVNALEKDNWGMKTKLSLFVDIINSGGVEYQVIGKMAIIKEKIGTDLSTIVRKGFNMQEFGVESDYSGFITYIEGFGAFIDKEDESKGRLKTSYKSPLADVYGILEGEPKTDERFTNEAALKAELKKIVDNSIAISLELSLEDLQGAGYPYAMAKKGDYIMIINELIDFQQKVRIVEVNESFDVTGRKIATQVVCGSLSMSDRQQASDISNSTTINNIINGNDKIPNSWLTDFININTNALNNARSELKFTEQGIIAIDKNNKNNLVLFNSAGIGISTNGGRTYENAMTAFGVNATAITTGVLRAGLVQVAFNAIGDAIEIMNNALNIYNNRSRIMQLDKNGNSFWNGSNSIGKLGTAGRLNIQGTAGNGDDYTGRALFLTLDGGEFMQFGNGKGDGILINKNREINSYCDLWVHGGGFHATTMSADDLNVFGSKNAIHPTRDGIRATPAYETAESYLGDIGESKTSENTEVKIPIETLFSDTVNTIEHSYQVFLQSYGEGHIWVSERNSDHFIVKSDLPNVPFAWEIKAKRRGYENDRLTVVDVSNETIENVWRKEKPHDNL